MLNICPDVNNKIVTYCQPKHTNEKQNTSRLVNEGNYKTSSSPSILISNDLLHLRPRKFEDNANCEYDKYCEEEFCPVEGSDDWEGWEFSV